MINRQYQEVQLSKKESELVEFLQTGSNEWMEAFYIYKNRRKTFNGDSRKQKSWFNRTLKSLKEKGLCENIPYVIREAIWFNPGLKASKAEFKALTLDETKTEFYQKEKQIIVSA